MTKPSEITLATLGGGELMELTKRDLRKICENIADPNVRTDAKRKLTITIEVTPDKKGQTAELKYSTKLAMPGPEGGKTTAYIAMAPGTSDISLFGLDLRQEQLFTEPKEPTVTEIRPVSAQTNPAELPATPAYAPPMVSKSN